MDHYNRVGTNGCLSLLVVCPHVCVAIHLESQNTSVLNPLPVNRILGWLIWSVWFHEHIILNRNHSRIGQFHHVLRVALQSIHKETILKTKTMTDTDTLPP